VPITGIVTVTNYAVAFSKSSRKKLTVTNKLAAVTGKIELYQAALETDEITSSSLHASGNLDRILPNGLTQWRVRVTSDQASVAPADVYLLNCTGNTGCEVAARQEISAVGKTVTIDNPEPGPWKIVVRGRFQVSTPVTYTIHEALLTSIDSASEATIHCPHGTSRTISLPTKDGSVSYAAFRIAGTPGNVHEKNGLLIAMTPLEAGAP
jgi:hypothetical protein